MKTKLTFLIALIFITGASIKAQTNFSFKSPVWLLSGNKNTNPATNFLGTTDSKDLVFRTNNIEHLRITQKGNVGIGSSNPQQKLDVNGNINVAPYSSYYVGNERVLSASYGAVFVGVNCGTHAAITASSNVGLGTGALFTNTQGSYNSAAGNEALFSNTTGICNSAFGASSLSDNTTANYNSAFGFYALGQNNNGTANTATGARALSSNTMGSENTANGMDVLFYNTKGTENTASGAYALYSNTTGNENTAEGYQALYSNTEGVLNTAAGVDALYYNTTGFDNTAFGNTSLYSNTTGIYNTGVGVQALIANVRGSFNTAIGYNANVNADSIWNSTVIGNSALITANNQIRIGNSNVKSIGGYVSWTKISDGRVKKNIKENVPGLSFINKLKPITYNLNLDAADKIVQRPVIKDKDSKTIQPTQEDIVARKAQEQIVYTGFIAQDVEKAAEEIGYDFSGVDPAKNDKDLYGLRYAEFVVPLVKAVQELSAKNDALEKRIEQLEALNTKDNSLAVISDASKFVKVYPNPVQSILNVDFNKISAGQKTINIYDADGKLRLTKSANDNTQINVKQLTGGAYLLKINDESGKVLYTGKVIKQ